MELPIFVHYILLKKLKAYTLPFRSIRLVLYYIGNYSLYDKFNTHHILWVYDVIQWRGIIFSINNKLRIQQLGITL